MTSSYQYVQSLLNIMLHYICLIIASGYFLVIVPYFLGILPCASSYLFLFGLIRQIYTLLVTAHIDINGLTLHDFLSSLSISSKMTFFYTQCLDIIQIFNISAIGIVLIYVNIQFVIVSEQLCGTA